MSKRDSLKNQLALRDIKMDLLPEGMERRKTNQSTWDARVKLASLTIEFVLYPPRISPSSDTKGSFKLVTHRNAMDHSLCEILRKQLADRSTKKEPMFPTWIKTVFDYESTNEENEVIPPLFLLEQYPPTNPPHKAYYSLDSDRPLHALLRQKGFVEYPVIEVRIPGSFKGDLVDSKDPARKKRKLDPEVGKRVLTGLVGDYDSGDDSGAKEREQEEEGVLQMLGEYDSGDDPLVDDLPGEEDEDDDEEPLDSIDQFDGDPQIRLEVLRELQRLQRDDAHEELDWGDEVDDDDLGTSSLPTS